MKGKCLILYFNALPYFQTYVDTVISGGELNSNANQEELGSDVSGIGAIEIICMTWNTYFCSFTSAVSIFGAADNGRLNAKHG